MSNDPSTTMGRQDHSSFVINWSLVIGHFLAGLSLALLLLAGGCAWHSRPAEAPTQSARGRNFYRSAERLPTQIRRVAVLPVTVEAGDWQAEEGRNELEPVLFGELGKTRDFELINVAPEQLRQWTSKGRWSAEEKLPPNFFEQLLSALGCDAVLFSRLEAYHAYKPLVVGWSLKLVDARAKSVLWAADEVFDSSETGVAKAAESYSREHVQATRPQADSHSILNSPRRFGQYTLSELLTTLPER